MHNLPKFIGFQWNKGNIGKNWRKHRVSDAEAEEVFFNAPLVLTPDIKHSKTEGRYYALGQTNKKRFIFISFTTKGEFIRIISARDMNKKERLKYYEKIKKTS